MAYHLFFPLTRFLDKTRETYLEQEELPEISEACFSGFSGHVYESLDKGVPLVCVMPLMKGSDKLIEDMNRVLTRIKIIIDFSRPLVKYNNSGAIFRKYFKCSYLYPARPSPVQSGLVIYAFHIEFDPEYSIAATKKLYPPLAQFIRNLSPQEVYYSWSHELVLTKSGNLKARSRTVEGLLEDFNTYLARDEDNSDKYGLWCRIPVTYPEFTVIDDIERVNTTIEQHPYNGYYATDLFRTLLDSKRRT